MPWNPGKEQGFIFFIFYFFSSLHITVEVGVIKRHLDRLMGSLWEKQSRFFLPLLVIFALLSIFCYCKYSRCNQHISLIFSFDWTQSYIHIYVSNAPVKLVSKTKMWKTLISSLALCSPMILFILMLCPHLNCHLFVPSEQCLTTLSNQAILNLSTVSELH